MSHEFLESAYDVAREAGVCEGCPAATAIFKRVERFELLAEKQENSSGRAGVSYGANVIISRLKVQGELIARDPCQGITPAGQCEVDSRLNYIYKLASEPDITRANEAACDMSITSLVIKKHEL